MKLINADEIAYESIDSSDTEEYFAKHGTGILAVRKEDIDKMPAAEPHWIPVTESERIEAAKALLEEEGYEITKPDCICMDAKERRLNEYRRSYKRT